MQSKAANLTFPFRSGTTDPTPVRYYDCNSGSQATAIPAAWYGRFVILTNDSANAAQFYISDDPASACDETATANAAGTSSAPTQLGGMLLGNTSRQARLPYPSRAAVTGASAGADYKTYYLVRASVSAATLRMELAEQ
jgi:hypothetical protein